MAGKVYVEGSDVVFRLEGVDMVLAIKRELRIPISHIKSVSTEKADWNMFNALKVAGARLPGVVEDGRFLSKEGFLFYDMHNPDKCVTVELEGDRYKKVIFEVEDKEATAVMIRGAIGR